jgi:hypothetical protein
MAIRKPFCNIGGRRSELPTADNLAASIAQPLSNNALPAPSVGFLLEYGRNIAERPNLGIIDSLGNISLIQESLASQSISLFLPASGTTFGTNLNLAWTTSGTVSHPAQASTNFQTSIRRTRVATAAAGNSTGGARSTFPVCWRGNAARLGGFFSFFRFTQPISTAGGRAAIGLANNASALNVNPSTVVNGVFVGYDDTDTLPGNWFLMHNDGTGTATKINLGANAVRNTTDVYDLFIAAAPNAATIGVEMWNVTTNTLIISTSLSTKIPANNLFLNAHVQQHTSALATALQIELARFYCQTLY